MNLVCVHTERKFYKSVPDNVQLARSTVSLTRACEDDKWGPVHQNKNSVPEDSHVLLRQILAADGWHSDGKLHRQNEDASQQEAPMSLHKDGRYVWQKT